MLFFQSLYVSLYAFFRTTYNSYNWVLCLNLTYPASNMTITADITVFMALLYLSLLLRPLTSFANRMGVASDGQRQRSEFDLDKPHRSNCTETATRTSAGISFRLVVTHQGSQGFGRVIVPPPPVNQNPIQAYILRNIVPPQRPPCRHRDGI